MGCMDADEELFQFWQERASKRRKRIVVGMQVACNEAKRHCLIGGALNLARTELTRRMNAPREKCPVAKIQKCGSRPLIYSG